MKARTNRGSPTGLAGPKFIAISICIGLLLGCSGKDSSTSTKAANEWEENFVSVYGAQEEYDKAVASLAWPQGVEAPQWRGGTAGTSYEIGAAEIDALMDWNCAWGFEWLTQIEKDDSSKDSEHALNMFVSFADTEGFKRFFAEDLQGHVKDYFEKAQLGDPAPARQDIKVNCPSTLQATSNE